MTKWILLMAGMVCLNGGILAEETIIEGRGDLNRIVIRKNGKAIAFNAVPQKINIDALFLTHARREIVETAREGIGSATLIHAPEASRPFLEQADEFWQNWWTKRHDYYDQQVTKVPVRDFPAHIYLTEGAVVNWEGVKIRFISLPGYSREGGGYVVDCEDGDDLLVVPDLVLRGAKVPDLYSFQESMPGPKIGSYHGHLGRLPLWIASLEKMKEELRAHPGMVLVPARGEAIRENPVAMLDEAVGKARAIYQNYLSTNALHWYFGPERMGEAARLVLGEGSEVKGMPFAEHVALPDWCHHIGTTKLLISEKTRRGWILDVGGRSALESLFKYRSTGLVEGFDGIFITHTHNDHSAFVADAAKEFGCPVYAIHQAAEVMERPGSWFYPGLPDKPVEEIRSMEDGAQMKWEEFTFTFRFFPGQMYPHGALLVEKPGDDPVFFIGDSFSPSGIDDYCLMNRNLMREGAGYLRCFDLVNQLPKDGWLVNQHIDHRFRFNAMEKDFLERSYRERIALVADFVAWDDPNYGVDEQWAWFHPYGQIARRGQTVITHLELTNHSPVPREYRVTIHGSENGLSPANHGEIELALPAGAKVRAAVPIEAKREAAISTHVYTASLLSRPAGGDWDMNLPHWCEGLVKVIED